MRLFNVALVSMFLSTAVFAAEQTTETTTTTTEEAGATKQSTWTATGTSTMGYVGAFKNHLDSDMMVSPTQIYQIGTTRTDWTLGFANGKRTDGNDEIKINGTQLNGGIVYNTPINLRTKLGFEYAMGSAEGTGTTKFDADVDSFKVTPGVAMPFGPVVVGLEAVISNTTTDVDGGSETKNKYTQIRPAVSYVGENFEAGLVFANKRDTDDAQEPQTITLHGRYATTKELALGGIIESVGYKKLDETANKDQLNIKATAEYDVGAYKVEGLLGYNGKYYKDTATAESIATTELAVAGDYRMGETATVGGMVNYEFGSKDDKSVEHKTNAFELGVRTNFTF